MYKALFLDIDGTTVMHGADNVPSPRVTAAIMSCENAGVTVSLASSRPPRVVQKILDHVLLTGLCVLSSGSQIYDPQKRRVISEQLFPKSAVKHILRAAEETNEQVSMYDGEKEFIYDGTHLPPKILGMYFPQVHPDILTVLMSKLQKVSGISLHRMDAWDTKFECLDIVNERASKLHGIVKAAKLLGVTTQEIIGVGDGYNDFPLLMACGLKIAMGNAVPELKAIADFIAPTVEEDGVATVIDKFILGY